MNNTYKFVTAALSITLVMLAMTLTFQVKKYNKPVVKDSRLNPIVRLTREGKTYCSGFVIDNNTIVTAAHCVTTSTPFGSIINPELVEIRSLDGKDLGVKAKIKSIMWQLDRAILKGDFRKFSPMKYINNTTDAVKIRVPGTKLISCGYPMGGEFYCGRSVYIEDYGFLLKIKGVLIPGMSGGPTMLMDGTVIGLNDAVEYDFSLISPLYEVDKDK